MEMTAAMEKLKQESKLTNNRAVSAAVRKVINDNSQQHEIAAPMGAKVIEVHKRPGDIVRVGDKIVTLLVDGKKVPILAKQEGVMQAINVSKGGIIGNSRPRAAKLGLPRAEGSILVTLRPLHSPSA
jgi:biotin carboxyl carrier protein